MSSLVATFSLLQSLPYCQVNVQYMHDNYIFLDPDCIVLPGNCAISVRWLFFLATDYIVLSGINVRSLFGTYMCTGFSVLSGKCAIYICLVTKFSFSSLNSILS